MVQNNLDDTVTDEVLLQGAKADGEFPLYLLILRYTPVVANRAKGFRGMGPELEDLVQEGMLGLLGAIRSFAPDGGASFRTYAGTCITNRMLSAVRAHHRGKHKPMNTYAPLEEAEGAGQPENDPQELFIRQEEEELRRQKIVELLSEFEQAVLERYLSGATYQEIAQELDTTAKGVDNALQRVRRKLHR